MSLWIHSIIYIIFPSSCMGWLQLVLLYSIYWIPDIVLGFIGALHLSASFNRCSYPMQVSIDSQYLGAPFLGPSFGTPLPICANNASFWVTFTLGFSLEELAVTACYFFYIFSSLMLCKNQNIRKSFKNTYI